MNEKKSKVVSDPSGEPRGRGRPSTLTKEQRQEQLRASQAAHRERVTSSGKVRLDVSIDARSKEQLEAYRTAQGLPNLGAALDKILLDNVDR
jgi:hypothetical protein